MRDEAPFRIYIQLFLTVMFHSKFMISAMTDFDSVNFPYLDGDVLRYTAYGVYISQLIHLLEYLVMRLTSTHVIKFSLLNFFNLSIS